MLRACWSLDQTLPPQYLCSEPLPQSSPAAPEFCPPCRPSCRSSEAEPRRHRSSWRTPQTWPGTARRSAPGITETPDSPSQESGDSLQARTCGGESGGKEGGGTDESAGGPLQSPENRVVCDVTVAKRERGSTPLTPTSNITSHTEMTFTSSVCGSAA